jgi:hypothetical protein
VNPVRPSGRSPDRARSFDGARITSGIEAKGRFGKQDFVYLNDEDVYRCPAGEKLAYHYTNEENGLVLRR